LKLLIILLPALVFGTNLKDVIKGIDTNPLLKSQNAKIKSLGYLLDDAKSYNKPKINLEVNTIRLEDTPTATFYIPNMPPFEVPVGTKDNVIVDLEFSYPIFSGFAISAGVNKAKLALVKEKLKRDDLKRKLYLKTVELFTSLYSLNQAIKAQTKAKDAIEDSLKVAKGMYENDLLGVSKLYNIEAKKYEVIALLQKLKFQKKIVQEKLYKLTKKRVDTVGLDSLKIEQDPQKLFKKALKYREDLKVISKDLGIIKEDIKAVKSGYYPKVALIGALKRESDDFSLSSNGYTNPNKSYVGVNLSWDLYSGNSTSSKKEALKAKKEALKFYLRDYKESVFTTLKSLLFELKSYKALLNASQKEIKAQRKYLDLTREKFKNSLVSSDELSRAILSYYQALSKKEDIRSKIFYLKNRLGLEVGLRYFSKKRGL